MKKERMVTGLDIGSSKVSALSAEISKNGELAIIAHATHESGGVKRGAVIDLNETVRSVSAVLKKLSGKIPNFPGDIYVNISGETVKGSKSKGMVPISVRGREVTRADIAKCIEAAGTIHMPFDREIIHRIVHDFSVDDQPPVKNPLGLYASRLECRLYVISAAANHIQNLYKCVSDAGYDIKETVYSGIADGLSLLDEREEEEGMALLNMGASLTELSVFQGGALTDFEIIPLGVEDIKGDDFRQDMEFGNILSRISLKLGTITSSGGKVHGVVVTGGGVFIDGMIEFLEERLSRPVKMGVTKDIRGKISSADSIRFATAIGLVKYAHHKYVAKAASHKNVINRVSSTVVEIFNNYF